jgi:dTDP-4-amino-4,6-dideoxygalactose transaminase
MGGCGSSYLASDLLCRLPLRAVGSAIRFRRSGNASGSGTIHTSWRATEHNVRLPIIPPHCEQSYHMFYLLMPSLEARSALIARISKRTASSAFSTTCH